MMSYTLENGMVMWVGTLREAVHIRDSILDPADFPWIHAEQQHTAIRFRESLDAQISEGTIELLTSIGALPQTDGDPEAAALAAHDAEDNHPTE